MKAILGTAGHIDHGKTALVGALTGEDTDRLPEEKRRGISIDLGFTQLTLDGAQVGIVDVPGHEDFIRNMLAGATGIDLLLLVVAADEGVMPQTREHVAIAELLGIPTAVVALTKVDLAEPEWLELVQLDVAEFLEGTAYADAPMAATSAETGQGIDELRDLIQRSLDPARRRPDDLFRLPIDRAFTVRGTGTVVTGTVWSGGLEVDQAARLLPGDVDARIRGLQVHGEDRSTVEAGERAAVALAGVDRDRVVRGMALVTDPAWRPTRMLTARVRVLSPTGWSLEPWQRVRVHLGTAEVMARVVLLEGQETLPPGAEGWVQLRLEDELVARTGDRFVVRSYSPVTTIGGGIVVEPLAPKRTRIDAHTERHFATLARGKPQARAWSLLEAAAGVGVPVRDLPVLAGARPDHLGGVLETAVRAGDHVFHPDAVTAGRSRLEAALDRHHADHPLELGMDREALRRAGTGAGPALVDRILDDLLDDGTVMAREGRVARRDWHPTLTPEQQARKERIARELDEAGLAAPRIDELADRLHDPTDVPELAALLEDEGQLVRLEHDLYVDAAAFQEAVRTVQDRLGGREDVAPSEFRDLLGISRRQLMPILAHWDLQGVTVRHPSGRTVPSP